MRSHALSAGSMEFRALGEVQVEVDGALVPLGGRRQVAVLAILLLEAERSVGTAEIADRLWPDSPPRNRGAVQVYISRLRRVLEAADGGRHGARIATTAGGYRLELGQADLDIRRFRDLVRAARAAVRPQDGADLLRQAQLVWRGPALAGLPDHMRSLAAELEEERLVAFEELMDAEITTGRYSKAVGPLTVAVDRYPGRERLNALLIEALHQLGRRGDALARYESLRRSLADIPPLRPPRPAGLPPDVPGFTGRAAELARLSDLLSTTGPEHAASVIAITGEGGVGKTALAVHWTRLVADRFPDGQLHVNLRGSTTTRPMPPADALARFLRALAAPPHRIPADVEEAAAIYRTVLSRRRMLVLLDNAADEDQIRPLLSVGGGSLTVITSRHGLTGLPAGHRAHRITLDALTEVEATTVFKTIVGDLVRTDPTSAATFADACGRLPLALRIGATRLVTEPDVDITALTAALRSARGVAGDGENGPVRAAFDLSYSALPAPAQRLFRRLGLHPGPDVTVDAAAALADIPRAEAEDLLATLMHAALIDPVGTHRFTLHDLLGGYSAELAARDDRPEQREAAVRRLAAWLLHTADAAR